jgi:hypothetical protein
MLETLLAAATPLLGFGFCLDYFVKNSFAVMSVCETPTREINLPSANLVAIVLVLACVLQLVGKD